MWFAAGLVVAVLAGASEALAAGGPRVVDDAAVETPGVCHVETWFIGSTGANRLYQFAPACTPRALPMLELGGSITQTWAPGTDDTVLGVAAKVNLVDETQRGWGVAVSGGIGLSVDSGEVDNANINVPLTIPVGPVRVNVNASWLWSRAEGHRAFVGVQADWTIRPDLDVMVEAFTRDTGRAGAQIGVRWTPGGGNMDFDLIAGRYIDGVTPTSLTAGVIVRF
ncbi:MAG: hypothetical protein ACT4N3_11205 [Sphingosinicella sp.]